MYIYMLFPHNVIASPARAPPLPTGTVTAQITLREQNGSAYNENIPAYNENIFLCNSSKANIK